MTSSDRTELPAGAKERAAERVGASVDASVDVGRAGSRGLRAGFACAEFNGAITDRLLTGALDVLEASGGDLAHSVVAWAPGAFELPLVALHLARSGSVDAVIALGAVIRGETGHYEFVAGQCAAGLQRVQLDTGVPVVFGVLTTETVGQALARSDGEDNKGREAAECALAMVTVLEGLGSVAMAPSVGFTAGTR